MSEIVISNDCLVKLIMTILEKHRSKIEDVFYDYKDDENLEFSLYFDFVEDASSLGAALDNVPHLTNGLSEYAPVINGGVVHITVPNVTVKQNVVDELRKNGWNINGG